jgi:hypothetical protein
MGYEGDYDLHKETEMYRSLHPTTTPEAPIGLILSDTGNGPEQPSVIANLLKDIDKKGKDAKDKRWKNEG